MVRLSSTGDSIGLFIVLLLLKLSDGVHDMVDVVSPGPINLPEAVVLEAVLNAPKVNYLFMCAKPDYSGRHNFAVTGTEHLENARVFQNWLGAEQKKKQK
ncbi:MAG: endolytic transglycosylase MltG [Bacteroidota bacterium]